MLKIVTNTDLPLPEIWWMELKVYLPFFALIFLLGAVQIALLFLIYRTSRGQVKTSGQAQTERPLGVADFDEALRKAKGIS